MTLEGLREEITRHQEVFDPWNWDYDEALALIARVEGVVADMREEAKRREKDYYQGFAADLLKDYADTLEGKE